ncbi:MAG: endolytic transglycosylase MltG [Proteobacteria bacterium]|nr:endolytic transglycosylase MltG [Pseudomonadota bacterium]
MRKFLYTLTLLIGLGIVGAVAGGIYAWDYFFGPGPLKEETVVVLQPGVGFNGIVAQLEQQGVIDNPLIFKAVVAALGQARLFKAGEYKFPAGATPRGVAKMLADGRVVVHKLTVPEGWTVAQVLAMLKAEPLLEGDITQAVPEGSLMPETYHFRRGEARSVVVTRMQDAMTRLLAELWEKRKHDLPLKTPQEALTLASIVEKETGVKDERGRVAAVFVNRLRIGMRLQSDPTVVYGMEQVMGAPLGRPLLSEDLRTETPYNTYMIAALPPGPIANPGKAALEATLSPPQTEDLYFVATGSGGHRFASNLDDHNKNVSQYRKALREQK